MKTYEQLHDLTDKYLGIPTRRHLAKETDGHKWYEVFEYLKWKYNTTKSFKEKQFRYNLKKLNNGSLKEKLGDQSNE